jgi:riboflavin-specific deaminase-like protein
MQRSRLMSQLRMLLLVLVALLPDIMAWMPHYSKQHIRPETSISLARDSNDSSDISGVTLKMAFDSQWGVADLSENKSERFTCGESLDMVHRLRKSCDAVLVGRSTVQIDDCTLTVRRVPLADGAPQPVRVILDPQLSLEFSKYKIFQDGSPTLVYHMQESAPEAIAEFPDVQLCFVPPRNSVLSATDVCRHLALQHNIHHIMVEGGPQTARYFLEDNMVDRAILVTAPLCFKEPLSSNMSAATFAQAGLEKVGSGTLGVDQVEYWSRPDLPWPQDPCISWP